MTTRLFIIILNCIVAQSVLAQTFLATPIEGEQGSDYIIVNYVDWMQTGIQDAYCGTKTYDGHEGTDFTIRSFRQMDSGVNVLAAATGVVTYIQDGEYDRETSGDVAKKLGNYIAIRHFNDYYTYYGHLKKNSIAVNVGDTVQQLDVIAQVGSSGNSTDPHLHFELWYDSSYVVDPFHGPCGNNQSLFNTPENYDTSLKVWEHGLIHRNNLTLNDLRERLTTAIPPYTFQPTMDSSLNFWAQLYGLKKDKELKVNWYNPSNTLWFTYSYALDQDYWYYYYWTYINHTNLEPGDWKVELLYDEQIILEEKFKITTSNHAQKQRYDHLCKNAFYGDILDNRFKDLTVFNPVGMDLSSSFDLVSRSIESLSPGVYHFILTDQDGKQCRLTKMIE